MDDAESGVCDHLFREGGHPEQVPTSACLICQVLCHRPPFL